MFICSECKQSIGPHVKPVRIVTGHRAVSYRNEYDRVDELGDVKHYVVDSLGMEFMGEKLVCPEDAQKLYDMEPVKNIPIRALERAGFGFEEPQVPVQKTSMVVLATEKAVARTKHNTKRSYADASAALQTVKQFMDNGGRA